MKSKCQNPKSKINPNFKFQISKQKFCYLSFVLCHYFVICALSFVILLTGCDAFVRKFTRTPKKEELPQEEMVLVPEEYKGPQMPNEELYRQYFLYWKSWQDELINALVEGGGQKKQIACLEEAINNLVNLKSLLDQNLQNKLDSYIAQMRELENEVRKDLYGNNAASNKEKTERIKRNILKDFSYNKIKERLL
jgi:hypothetical protein